MNKDFETLRVLAHKNITNNPFFKGKDETELIGYFFSGIQGEVSEVEIELKPQNSVHLTDELSDIIWTNLMLLETCARAGWIDSIDSVYEHAKQKFIERSPAFETADDNLWQEIKEKQKEKLKRNHEDRYG